MRHDAFLEAALEDCLRAMKGGATRDDCLRAYPEVRGELEPMLATATGLSGLPGAAMPETARRRVGESLEAAMSGWRHGSGFGLPAPRIVLIPSALALVAVLAVLATLLALGGSSLARADTVLSILQGEVVVQTRDGTVSAHDGMLLRAGDRVTTRADARAVLTFFDGSTVTLDANTHVLLREVGERKGRLIAVLSQDRGSTWTYIPTDLGSADLEIHTPNASVRSADASFATSVDGEETSVSAAAEGGALELEGGAGQDAAQIPGGSSSSVAAGGAVAAPAAVATPADELNLLIRGTTLAYVKDANGATVGVIGPGVPVNQITGASVHRSGNEIRIRIPNPARGAYQVGIQAPADGSVLVSATLGRAGPDVRLAAIDASAASNWQVGFALHTDRVQALRVVAVQRPQDPAVVPDDAADRARSVNPTLSGSDVMTPSPQPTATPPPAPTGTPRIRPAQSDSVDPLNSPQDAD